MSLFFYLKENWLKLFITIFLIILVRYQLFFLFMFIQIFSKYSMRKFLLILLCLFFLFPFLKDFDVLNSSTTANYRSLYGNEGSIKSSC